MPLGLLVKDGPTMQISLGMLILCSVQNFGYYGLMIWLPSYLSAHFGYTLTQSALWTAVTVLGMAFGILVFGHFADRVGNRPALFTFQAGAFIMVLLYSQLISPIALLIAWRVRRPSVRAVPDGSSGNRRKRDFQPRAWCWRFWPVCGRDCRRSVFLHGSNRAARNHLSRRYSRDRFAHPGEERRAS